MALPSRDEEFAGQLTPKRDELSAAKLVQKGEHRPPTAEEEAIQEDWIFPSIIALGPTAAIQTIRAGGSLLYGLTRGVATSAIAGTAEATYIAPLSEIAGEIHPYLKPLVGMTLGIGSAITLEAMVSETILKAMTKSAPRFWNKQLTEMQRQGILSEEWLKAKKHIITRMDQGDTSAMRNTLNSLMREAHQERLLKSSKELERFKKTTVGKDIEATEKVIRQLKNRDLLLDDDYARLAQVAERDAVNEFHDEFLTAKRKIVGQHAKTEQESHEMFDIIQRIEQEGGIQSGATPYRFVDKEGKIELIKSIGKRHPKLVTDSSTEYANLNKIASDNDYQSVTKMLKDVERTPTINGFRRQQEYKFQGEFDRIYRDEIFIRTAEKESEYLAKVLGVEKLGKPAIQKAAKILSEGLSVENMVKEVASLRKATQRLAQIIKRQTAKEMTAANKAKITRLQNAHKSAVAELRMANKMRNEVRQIHSRLSRVLTRGKDMRADSREQIQNFLAPMFGKPTKRLNENMWQFLSRKYNDEFSVGADILIKKYSDLIKSVPSRTHGFEGFTHAQIKEVDEFVKTFRFVARQEKLIRYKGERALNKDIAREIRNTAGSALAKQKFLQPRVTQTHLDELAKGELKAIGKYTAATSDIVSGFFASLKRMEPIVRQLDGFKEFGTAWKQIFNKMVMAEIEKEELGQMVFGRFQKIFDTHKFFTRMGKKPGKYWTATSGNLAGRNIDKETALVMSLNSGNKGNMEAMLKGLQVTEEELNTFLSKALNEYDTKLVNDIWDELDNIFPILAKVHKDTTGRTLQKLKGGRYYPIVADRRYLKVGEKYEDLFAHTDPDKFWATVEDSFTKLRIGGVKAVRMDLKGLTQHLEDTVHWSVYRQPVNDVQRLVKHPDFIAAVEETMGRKIYDQFDPWLKNISRPYRTDYGDTFEHFLSKARRNVTTVALGMVPKVGVKQTLSLITALPDVGHRNMLGSLIKFTARPTSFLNAVAEASPEMAFRQKTWQREIAEMMATKSFTRSGLKGGARNLYFKFIHLFDRITASTVWHGAYLKGLDEFGGNAHRAVDKANLVVRKTQPASAAKDLPLIMRAGEVKRSVTMFYSYYSVYHNQGAEIVRRGLAGNMSVPKVASTLAYLAMAPTIAWYLGGVAWNQMTGRPQEEFDMEKLAKTAAVNATSGIPVLRDLASATVMGYDYRISPLADIGTEAKDTAIAMYELLIKDKEWDDYDTVSSLELAGYVFNLPTRQMATTILGAKHLIEGQTDDITELLVRPSYK